MQAYAASYRRHPTNAVGGMASALTQSRHLHLKCSPARDTEVRRPCRTRANARAAANTASAIGSQSLMGADFKFNLTPVPDPIANEIQRRI